MCADSLRITRWSSSEAARKWEYFDAGRWSVMTKLYEAGPAGTGSRCPVGRCPRAVAAATYKRSRPTSDNSTPPRYNQPLHHYIRWSTLLTASFRPSALRRIQCNSVIIAAVQTTLDDYALDISSRNDRSCSLAAFTNSKLMKLCVESYYTAFVGVLRMLHSNQSLNFEYKSQNARLSLHWQLNYIRWNQWEGRLRHEEEFWNAAFGWIERRLQCQWPGHCFVSLPKATLNIQHEECTRRQKHWNDIYIYIYIYIYTNTSLVEVECF